MELKNLLQFHLVEWGDFIKLELDGKKFDWLRRGAQCAPAPLTHHAVIPRLTRNPIKIAE